MKLSTDCVLLYVLQKSGVLGRLTAGRIEYEGGTLNVYHWSGELNEYISGSRLRSWCVVRYGRPVAEWSKIMPEDEQRLSAKW